MCIKYYVRGLIQNYCKSSVHKTTNYQQHIVIMIAGVLARNAPGVIWAYRRRTSCGERRTTSTTCAASPALFAQVWECGSFGGGALLGCSLSVVLCEGGTRCYSGPVYSVVVNEDASAAERNFLNSYASFCLKLNESVNILRSNKLSNDKNFPKRIALSCLSPLQSFISNRSALS